ncbi:MAG: potassium channel family protein [Candidatus Altiarchaeia archaeon]
MKVELKNLIGSHIFISVAIIVVIILFGTAGYMILESITPLDALYHTVNTIATVGYSDIATKNETRIFTIVLILVSVASFYYFAGAIAETLIAGRLFEVLKLKRLEDALEQVQDHVILCGYGDVGTLLADKIDLVVVVEKNDARFAELLKKRLLCVKGDSTSPEILESAGIKRAKAMIVALDSDPEIVYTILTAKEIHPGIRIYARANETMSVNKMKKAGADYVICLPEVGSRDLLNALVGRGNECLGVH